MLVILKNIYLTAFYSCNFLKNIELSPVQTGFIIGQTNKMFFFFKLCDQMFDNVQILSNTNNWGHQTGKCLGHQLFHQFGGKTFPV